MLVLNILHSFGNLGCTISLHSDIYWKVSLALHCMAAKFAAQVTNSHASPPHRVKHVRAIPKPLFRQPVAMFKMGLTVSANSASMRMAINM